MIIKKRAAALFAVLAVCLLLLTGCSIPIGIQIEDLIGVWSTEEGKDEKMVIEFAESDQARIAYQFMNQKDTYIEGTYSFSIKGNTLTIKEPEDPDDFIFEKANLVLEDGTLTLDEIEWRNDLGPFAHISSLTLKKVDVDFKEAWENLVGNNEYLDQYQKVIDEYQQASRNRSTNGLSIITQSPLFRNTDTSDTFSNGIFYFFSQGYPDDLVYELKDIDDDSVPELFISLASTKAKGNFGAVYTIIDGKPRLLYSSSGMNTLHYLTDDNMILMEGYESSDSATDSYGFAYPLYSYSDGKETLESKYFYKGAFGSSDLKYFYVDKDTTEAKSISKAEYEAFQNSKDDLVYDFNFQPLSYYELEYSK